VRDRVRHLSKGVAIYGAGEAAIQVVGFLLLAVYVQGGFLGRADYGALAILTGVETFAKVISRWGLDGAFMRYYHDRPAGGPLEHLTSTIVWFILLVDAALFAAALGASGWFGSRVFDDPSYTTALRLMLVNTFLIGTTFVPFHLMRMRDQAVTYSAFMFARSFGTLVLRIVLVIGLHLGVAGMFLADLIVTLALLPVLSRWMLPHLRLVFSFAELRMALRFGLPRLPHGMAQQALDAGNTLLLSRYIPIDRLGVYKNGVTLGTGIKFFMAAFETAWAPFYYSTARQPDAKEVFRKVTTYGLAILVLLAAGTTVVARDVILVMLKPEYLDAARVIPLIAAGMALQGTYLLTSIGLNLTGRTEFYPVATFAAAAVGLGSGLWLMPAYGVTGAAVAFFLAYLTQASIAFALAQRVYPMRYETGRIIRILVSGAVATATGLWAFPEMPALLSFLVRGTTAATVYLGLLWISGFLRDTERAFLAEQWSRFRQRAAPPRAQG
jgi:O-antigen/teichoic acid export membrane protein